MSRPLRLALGWSAVIGVAAALAAGTGWLATGTAVGAASVSIAVALVTGLLAASAEAEGGGAGRRPSGQPADGVALEAAAPRMASPEPLPPDLLAAERLVVLAGATAGDVHFRLRPALRDIARELLASGPSVDLDHDPRAADLLGRPLWELVRPDRPAPEVRQAPGLQQAELHDLLDRLEALA